MQKSVNFYFLANNKNETTKNAYFNSAIIKS
jgi:hypothetical protein